MKYKFYIFAPEDEKIIDMIIKAASRAGAGIMGEYSQCAFIQKGQGRWKPGNNAHPFIGKAGKLSKVNEVKIEMECPVRVAKNVAKAIREVHPYEEVVIDFIKLEDVI